MYPIGAELSVRESFYRHVSTYIGNGLVAHNHPEDGESLVTLERFAKGRPITMTKGGIGNLPVFFLRVHHMLLNPTSYNYITNNCEHTVSRLRTGLSSSPQVGIALGVAAAVVLGIAASKKAH